MIPFNWCENSVMKTIKPVILEKITFFEEKLKILAKKFARFKKTPYLCIAIEKQSSCKFEIMRK